MPDINTSTTAADEAKAIHKERRPMMLVTTSLPNGIVLNNHLDADGNATAAANVGPGTPFAVKGSVAVDKAFYDAWAKHNPDMIAKGLVSAVPVAEIERDEAEKNDGVEAVGSKGESGSEPDFKQAR